MTTNEAAARPAKKIAARKKIAAAALALGAGVLGTGFAAGVITFTPGAEHGFGQGTTTVEGVGNVIDITGQLQIDRAAKGGAWNVSKNTYDPMTPGDSYTITGFGEVANAIGANYEVRVLRANYSQPTVEASGTVESTTSVRIPVVKGTTAGSNVTQVFVVLTK